jgi:ACT domain-containing protein
VNIITVIMARPKKAPKDRKTASIRVPMTRDEQKAIEAGAEAAGIKIVAFVRASALRAANRLK